MSTAAPRVSHVNYSPGGSVDRKILAEAAAARRLGLPLDFYIMNWTGRDEDRDNVHLRTSAGARICGGPLGLIRANRQRLADLAPLAGPGRTIVLRFPKVPINSVALIMRYGRCIITEHHTDEVAEILVRPGLKRRLLALAVGMGSRLLLRRVAGHIAVTDEIRRVEMRKSGLRRAVTITNGVDTAAVERTGFRPFDGSRLTLLAVSSEFQPWYAVDRLLAGLAEYQGPVKVVVILVGKASRDVTEAAARMPAGSVHEVALEGTLTGQQMDDRFRAATVSVGSLGLHRNRMREACPLKVREYVARGIPFIYAYDDPDIPADASFALKLPADETPVDIERVVEFARRVSAVPGLSAQMREYAAEHLDWGNKVRQIYEFAAGLQSPAE